MRTVLTALALFAGVAACSDRGKETGRVSGSADTSVTTRTAEDTTIVTSDTTVRVDTTKMEGDMKTDTAKH
jgi:pectate lyase